MFLMGSKRVREEVNSKLSKLDTFSLSIKLYFTL